MCAFGGGGGGGGNSQLLQLLQLNQAQQAQAQAQAAIAQANLDTESSRVAAEDRIRKANTSQGFLSSLLGGNNPTGGSVGFKMLFGQ